MGHVERRRRYEAPAELVWDVVTDPEVYAAVAPNLAAVDVVSGSGVGMVRRCVDADGNAWTESCTRWEEGRSFAVEVDVAASEFHRRWFSRFEGSWAVSERPDGALVAVAFDYDARYGPLGRLLSKYFEYRGAPIIEAIFDGWEAEIRSRLDGDAPRPNQGVRSR